MIKEDQNGNVAVASNALLVLTGVLSDASSEEHVAEACLALFGRTPPDIENMAIEMSRLFDDEASCKWGVEMAIFLPASRIRDDEFCDKLRDS